MKKRILMLGAGVMQGVAIACAKEKGWEVVACDGNPDAPCRKAAHRFAPIDLKDVGALTAFAKELQANGGLDGVFTAATDFSASVAAVARSCGLPGHSLEAALNASDKTRMRACFAKAGVPSPKYIVVGDPDHAICASLMKQAEIGYPVVVKPVDNMGARGCRKVDSETSLSSALSSALRFSRSGTAIVEEFMEGPEFSIEGLFFDDALHLTGLADRHIRFSPYFIEMGHTIPSSFPAETQEALVRVFEAGVRSLGLSHGAVKGDIKLTPLGPMVGEIAGRLSGGYMSGWTFPYSSGIDLTGAALDLCAGSRPDSLVPAIDMVCAERAWISIPGTASVVSGLQKARTIPFVRDILPRIEEGASLVFPTNNVEKCGNCLAVAPDRLSASSAAEEACRTVFIRLEPGNPETDAFLSVAPGCEPRFPPDAFTLSQDSYPLSFDQPVLYSNVYMPKALFSRKDSATDWHGSTAAGALSKALSIAPGLSELLSVPSHPLYQPCWLAFLRGGAQGLVYVYDANASS